MQSIFFKDANENLEQLCLKICNDHEPYLINRDDNNHVVMLSLADFNAWQETHYLLSNPANAERLLRSVEHARHGRVTAHELLDE